MRTNQKVRRTNTGPTKTGPIQHTFTSTLALEDISGGIFFTRRTFKEREVYRQGLEKSSRRYWRGRCRRGGEGGGSRGGGASGGAGEG